ncbi:hypothetical protein [Geothrix sp. 21YS21S-2]|uniref:hypothetical protein n=1 Tax=Geothrix sp. 21YS21S-2 TaxID=3068893 RepID=UPI0027BA5272|nr:hypothetical protein [Geothrix sp. 21YS21S-2]
MGFSTFGPILVAQELVTDGLGTLSRAWERDAEGETRPIFLRRFAPELLLPQVTSALEASQRSQDVPPSCGTGHQFGTNPAPHWKLDHRMSRSIRRIQEKCREEAFPLDLALSLHIAWTLAHVCAKFWRAGQSVGALSLDSVRVDFEGSLFLPDLAWMPTLIRLADEEPGLRSALPGLPRGPVTGDLRDEALRFGTFLYELITFEALPAGVSPAEAIGQAQAWTPEGPVALPEAVRNGLARLLGGGMPFETLEGALKAFEKIVFEDEDGPSTFNLAHLMHTLFRQDYTSQQDQLEKELEALRTHESWWVEASGSPDQLQVSGPKRTYAGITVAGILVAACAAVAGFLTLRHMERSRQGLETELASLRSTYQLQVQKGTDAASLERTHLLLKEGLERAATTATNAEQRRRLGMELEHLQAEKPARQASAMPGREEPAPVSRLEPTGPFPANPKAAPGAAPIKDVAPNASPVAVTQDRPAQVRSLSPVPWPQGEPKVPVVLRVFVHEDGHALRATPVAGPAPGSKAAQAAMETVLKGRYLPALRGGKPVRDWVEVQVKP